MLAAGRAATQQFAAFRLALLDVEDARLAEADLWRTWLLANYPDAPLTAAAEALLLDAAADLPLSTSCARISFFLMGEARPTGVLDGEVGYGNPNLGAIDVCPVGQTSARSGSAAEAVHLSLPQVGVAAVDAAYRAAFFGDANELLAQVALRPYACVSSGMGALLCQPGEAEGTLVDGFIVSGCDGIIERDPVRISAALIDVARATRGLVGVAVSASGSEYRVALATPGPGMALYVDASGIYGVNRGCERPAAELLYDWPEATILLPPPGEP